MKPTFMDQFLLVVLCKENYEFFNEAQRVLTFYLSIFEKILYLPTIYHNSFKQLVIQTIIFRQFQYFIRKILQYSQCPLLLIFLPSVDYLQCSLILIFERVFVKCIWIILEYCLDLVEHTCLLDALF